MDLTIPVLNLLSDICHSVGLWSAPPFDGGGSLDFLVPLLPDDVFGSLLTSPVVHLNANTFCNEDGLYSVVRFGCPPPSHPSPLYGTGERKDDRPGSNHGG